MPRLLALILTALLFAGVAVPTAATAATKSKSSSSSKSKSKSKSSEDCDLEDWAARDDDCDDYELVNGVPQKKSSCGGLGFAPLALGGGLGGRLLVRRKRRR